MCYILEDDLDNLPVAYCSTAARVNLESPSKEHNKGVCDGVGLKNTDGARRWGGAGQGGTESGVEAEAREAARDSDSEAITRLAR